jgi:putative two-component system response regulator
MTRVVIVDDDPDFTHLIGELLRDQGYEVVSCDDDRRALECVVEAKPDLIILDLRMSSRESGWRILEELTSEGRTKSVPVIISSAALDDLNSRADELQQRGVETLAKPFDIDDLLTMIERMTRFEDNHRNSDHASKL